MYRVDSFMVEFETKYQSFKEFYDRTNLKQFDPINNLRAMWHFRYASKYYLSICLSCDGIHKIFHYLVGMYVTFTMGGAEGSTFPHFTPENPIIAINNSIYDSSTKTLWLQLLSEIKDVLMNPASGFTIGTQYQPMSKNLLVGVSKNNKREGLYILLLLIVLLICFVYRYNDITLDY